MADYTKPSDDPNVLVEPTTHRDDIALGETVSTQVLLLGRNPSDGHVDTFDPATLATTAKQDLLKAVVDELAVALDTGTFAYDAGTAAGTVDVPAGARLRRVTLIAGSGGPATITIGGGDTITVPAGAAFDEKIAGDAIGADVVIGGAVSSYYASWVV